MIRPHLEYGHLTHGNKLRRLKKINSVVRPPLWRKTTEGTMNAYKYMNNFKTHHNWIQRWHEKRSLPKLKPRCRTDRKLHFYSNRVVDWWNKITQEGIEAPSIDAFKNSLDNHSHDDVIKWKHFPRNWPFVRGIHRSRWIPHTEASNAELWCFLWSASE